MKLVYYLISKYYPTYLGDEDLQQVGMLGLCKAADTWNEEKSKFSTYASKCILNEMNQEFRKRKKYNGQWSLDKTVNCDEDVPSAFGDFIVGETDVDIDDTNDFISKLSKTERAVLTLLEDGYSCSEISNKLGISTQCVNKCGRNIQLKWGKYDE